MRARQELSAFAFSPDQVGYCVFGQVIGIHIDDSFIKNGRLDTAAMQPIARCGYSDYAVVDRVFSVARPRDSDADPADKLAAE